jgi:hypothetical protein
LPCLVLHDGSGGGYAGGKKFQYFLVSLL